MTILPQRTARQTGYSLIELLIVISIISVLVVLLIPQFNSFNQSQVLQNTASQLQSNLRTAQNNAISGVKCNINEPASSWQIIFTEGSEQDNYEIKALCSGANPTLVTIGTYLLPKDIRIQSIKADGTQDIDPINGFTISFQNISGKVLFSFADLSNKIILDPAKEITVTIGYTNSVIIIKIDKGGTISIQSGT